MYLQRIELKHIKMFKDFVWELPEDTHPAGWHVLLGDNGSGKTTILKAVSLALLGQDRCATLTFHHPLDKFANGHRPDKAEAAVSLKLYPSQGPYADSEAGTKPITCKLKFYNRSSASSVKNDGEAPLWRPIENEKDPVSGWFSAAFGVSRRIEDGDDDFTRIAWQDKRLACHINLFSDTIRFMDLLGWLRNHNDPHQPEEKRNQFLHVKHMLSQDFLPHTRQARLGAGGLDFEGAGGNFVWPQELGDGARSALGLALSLIRMLINVFGPNIFEQDEATGLIRVMPPGVVLIDEVDVHLHPTWQQRVGQWFTKYFPNIQFIVATHSPLVCQAAVKGTIFKLPAPGSDEPARFVEGEERARLLYGNILDAYGTGVFGQISASPEGQKMANELAWLDAQANERALTEDELDRRTKLRTILHTSSTDDAQAKLQSMLELLAASLPAQREEP